MATGPSAGFMRMVGAEMPTNSDLIKWAEQGRLHTKYTNCTLRLLVPTRRSTWTVDDASSPLEVHWWSGASLSALVRQYSLPTTLPVAGLTNKAVVTLLTTADTFTVAYYEAAGQAMA